jgi:hypothetical protein
VLHWCTTGQNNAPNSLHGLVNCGLSRQSGLVSGRVIYRSMSHNLVGIFFSKVIRQIKLFVVLIVLKMDPLFIIVFQNSFDLI